MTRSRILAAHQPAYLPYPGLINKILRADVFVVMDAMQYVNRDWQNRNRIRTSEGSRWLTIPVHARRGCRITEATPVSTDWVDAHARIVAQHYRRSRLLSRAEAVWEALRPVAGEDLATISWTSTQALMAALGCPISTEVVFASTLMHDGETFDKRFGFQRWCHQTGCDTYLTGRGGMKYLDPADWHSQSLRLMVNDDEPPRYEQLYPGWVPNLSALDLLLCAPDCRAHLTSHRRELQR